MMNYINYFIHIIKTMIPMIWQATIDSYKLLGPKILFYYAIVIAVVIVEQKIADAIYELLPINKTTQVVIRIITLILGFTIYATSLYMGYINNTKYVNFDFSCIILSVEYARITECAWGGILYLLFKLTKAIKEDVKTASEKKQKIA